MRSGFSTPKVEKPDPPIKPAECLAATMATAASTNPTPPNAAMLSHGLNQGKLAPGIRPRLNERNIAVGFVGSAGGCLQAPGGVRRQPANRAWKRYAMSL